MSAFVVLQLPYVQNRLFGKLLQHLSHTIQLAITHQRLQRKWLCRASLAGLTIKGLQDNATLAVDQLVLAENPFQLLMDAYITLKTVRIKSAQVRLCKEGKKVITCMSCFSD